MGKGAPCNENRFFPVKILHRENFILSLFWPCTVLQTPPKIILLDFTFIDRKWTASLEIQEFMVANIFF